MNGSRSCRLDAGERAADREALALEARRRGGDLDDWAVPFRRGLGDPGQDQQVLDGYGRHDERPLRNSDRVSWWLPAHWQLTEAQRCMNFQIFRSAGSRRYSGRPSSSRARASSMRATDSGPSHSPSPRRPPPPRALRQEDGHHHADDRAGEHADPQVVRAAAGAARASAPAITLIDAGELVHRPRADLRDVHGEPGALPDLLPLRRGERVPGLPHGGADRGDRGELRAAAWRSASTIRVSMSSWRTTSSLVGKYRKNVDGDTSAAAAICSTVVA